MELLVQKNGIYFIGKVKDLISALANYPPQLTLQDLIRLKLN